MRNLSPVVIFDFGGVLVDWDPRYLYRKLIPTEVELEKFLVESRFYHWNERADHGESWQDLLQEAQTQCPQHVPFLRQFPERFLESLSGSIPSTVETLENLKRARIPLYGLTNWSQETFPLAFKEYPFFKLFDGILVSGEEKIAKPDPEIFQALIQRYNLQTEHSFFVDDNANNIQAAKALGIKAHHFHKGSDLNSDLKAWLKIYSREF